MPTDLNQPIAGRHVHYVLPASSGNAGQHRAAHVTSEHGGPTCNLIVDLDRPNDIGPGHPYEPSMRVWSAPFEPKGNTPGTWHWMEGTMDFTDSQGYVPTAEVVANRDTFVIEQPAPVIPVTLDNASAVASAPPVFTPAPVDTETPPPVSQDDREGATVTPA